MPPVNRQELLKIWANRYLTNWPGCKQSPQTIVGNWTEFFDQTPIVKLETALKELIETERYFPTIAVIRQKLIALEPPAIVQPPDLPPQKILPIEGRRIYLRLLRSVLDRQMTADEAIEQAHREMDEQGIEWRQPLSGADTAI
jgi:hypothetical protein